MRGKDLNLRPLGYEFDLCFVWFHVVPCISTTYSILLAIGSSCFGLLFLGSGSTLGSTSPPVSVGQSAPSLSMLVLWVAYPKTHLPVPPRHSPGQPKESPRTSVLDCRSGLPGILRDQHRDRGPRTACYDWPLPYWGSEGGEFRTRGTRFSEFPTEGSRWQTRDVFTEAACWSRVPVRLGGETFSEFPAMPPRRVISDFLLR